MLGCSFQLLNERNEGLTRFLTRVVLRLISPEARDHHKFFAISPTPTKNRCSSLDDIVKFSVNRFFFRKYTKIHVNTPFVASLGAPFKNKRRWKMKNPPPRVNKKSAPFFLLCKLKFKWSQTSVYTEREKVALFISIYDDLLLFYLPPHSLFFLLCFPVVLTRGPVFIIQNEERICFAG